MKHTIFRRAGALVLLCALLCALALPAVADESETVHIRSAEDFRAFVSNCSYDAWSVGKTVYLDRDISLSGAADFPAASFGGTFEGGGHTISGLEITESVSPAGLFGVIAPGGVVRDVTVEGVVSPAGSATRLGGIAGVNRGTITGCGFSGTVSGDSLAGGICGENAAGALIGRCNASGGVFSKRMTGGVVGSNSGTVQSCANRAYVNTNTADPTISLSELDGDVTDALRRLSSPDTYNLVTDSGGIAGFSDGALQSCSNYGTVGYQHIGYNVGGVVGRLSGTALDCTNRGAVCGRKDVGGVVGQLEPAAGWSFTGGESHLQLFVPASSTPIAAEPPTPSPGAKSHPCSEDVRQPTLAPFAAHSKSPLGKSPEAETASGRTAAQTIKNFIQEPFIFQRPSQDTIYICGNTSFQHRREPPRPTRGREHPQCSRNRTVHWRFRPMSLRMSGSRTT